jgi:hypothetical protein
MTTPAITALIDTFNHERFIEQAVESVLHQDFPVSEMEILVVDDGSTDRTPDLVRKFEPRVRLIRKTNGGQASAFNTGIPEGRGEIIAFLDGDDWWAPNKISCIAEAFEKNPQVGMIGHGFVQTSRESERVISSPIPRPLRLDSVDSAHLFRLHRCYLGTSRLALRTSIAREVVPIPESLVFEADEYLFTVAGVLSPFIILPDPLTYYRAHGDSLYLATGSNRNGTRRKQQILAALATDLRKGLSTRNVSPEVTECILEIVEAEALQLRLMLDGGAPWETVRTETTIYRVLHSHASWPQRIYHHLAFLPAYVLPPNWFYRARRWITSQPWYEHSRRSLLPIPKITTSDGSSRAEK